MIKKIYAFYDTVSGSTISLQDSDRNPTEFVTIKKRELLMQPNPIFEDVEIHLIGEYDDEDLSGKMVLHQKVGDFKEEFSKLRALAAAQQAKMQEVKETVGNEVKTDVCA